MKKIFSYILSILVLSLIASLVCAQQVPIKTEIEEKRDSGSIRTLVPNSPIVFATGNVLVFTCNIVLENSLVTSIMNQTSLFVRKPYLLILYTRSCYTTG